MQYLYETEKRNYEDYASGRVLYNAQGTTAFPVRLASEIFLRATSYLRAKNTEPPYRLHDPCCGGAYLLATLGIMHGKDLIRIEGTDVNPEAIQAADRNLSLINPEGMDRRIVQLEQMIRDYGKASHLQALESALRLREQIGGRGTSIAYSCSVADALKPTSDECSRGKVDLVMTDLPYGGLVKWSDGGRHQAETLLDRLLSRLTARSVVAVIADKSAVLAHDRYRRLDKFKLGKRQAAILEPIL